jgi:hypothetical protein
MMRTLCMLCSRGEAALGLGCSYGLQGLNMEVAFYRRLARRVPLLPGCPCLGAVPVPWACSTFASRAGGGQGVTHVLHAALACFQCSGACCPCCVCCDGTGLN